MKKRELREKLEAAEKRLNREREESLRFRIRMFRNTLRRSTSPLWTVAVIGGLA